MAVKPTTCKEAIARWEKSKGETAADATVIELQFQWPPIEKMDGALSTLVSCEKLSLSSNMIDKIAGIAGMRSLKILSLGRNYIKTLAGIETVADTLEELWISYNPIDKLKGIGSLKNLRVLYMSNNVIKEWVEFNRLQTSTLYPDGNTDAGKPFQSFVVRIQKDEVAFLSDRWNVHNVRMDTHSASGYPLVELLDVIPVPFLQMYPIEYLEGSNVAPVFKALKECPALRDLVFIGNPICENQPDVETWRTQASNRLQQIAKLDGIPIVRETE